MKSVHIATKVLEAAIVIGVMAYWAIDKMGAPWPLALFCGLFFFGNVSLIRFIALRAFRGSRDDRTPAE